ncbi:murein hydrolase activator EnvC family protein [Amorphus coralli]|uniref:murein hydrolase activator EnvC family protein n=1 Tax=Amorphus coralli TaxID=340680 RepID=UPI00036D7737|nr:peptidoglycan DD-metalloendopeptidase family protein [Amorphus coralli]
MALALSVAVLVATGEGAFAQPVAAEEQERIEARQQELEALREQMQLTREREAELAEEVAALDQDRAALTEDLVRTGERIARLERRISDSEERLAKLSRNEDGIRLSLNARRGVIAEVLAALQRIGAKPPPAVAVQPEDALAAVRSAILLGAVVPELNVEAEALAADLKALTTLKAQIAEERESLSADLASLTEERARVQLLVEEKKAQRDEQVAALEAEREKAEDLASRTSSLQELIEGLEREVAGARKAAEAARTASEAETKPSAGDPGRLSPAVPFARARGSLPLPAQGAVLRRFGEPDATGDAAKGISISTLPQAQILAPADGWVVYAGPFRSYGQLLILNVGDGYHVLLAGMDRTDVQLGQFVLAGEPVGTMGSQRFASAATMDIESPRPVLYVEFRKDGSSIDPDPWWSARADEEVRG